MKIYETITVKDNIMSIEYSFLNNIFTFNIKMGNLERQFQLNMEKNVNGKEKSIATTTVNSFVGNLKLKIFQTRRKAIAHIYGDKTIEKAKELIDFYSIWYVPDAIMIEDRKVNFKELQNETLPSINHAMKVADFVYERDNVCEDELPLNNKDLINELLGEK